MLSNVTILVSTISDDECSSLSNSNNQKSSHSNTSAASVSFRKYWDLYRYSGIIVNKYSKYSLNLSRKFPYIAAVSVWFFIITYPATTIKHIYLKWSLKNEVKTSHWAPTSWPTFRQSNQSRFSLSFCLIETRRQ